jgi:AcrR family transcriptional regulator
MIIHPSDEDMLDAASAIFAKEGFRAATMEEIAARAKSTKPTLYAHFGSKEELYRLCAERAADSLRGQLFQAYAEAADLSLERQVRAGMTAFFDYASTHSANFRLLFGADAVGAAGQAQQQLTAVTTSEIARRVRDFTERRGQRRWGISAELCASLIVGLTVEGARYALHAKALDATSAGDFTTHFTVAALRHLDPAVAAAIDDEASR